MGGGQPGGEVRGVIAAVLLAVAAGLAGCMLQSGGALEGDAIRPDDADGGGEVPADDGGDDDVPPDAPPDGSCLTDRDCGDLTCLDGVATCVAGACVRLPPLVCPDDRIGCTKDFCDRTANACVHRATAAWCPGGYTCDLELGCIRARSPDTCSADAECNDGVACTVDRCVGSGIACANDPLDADGDGVGDINCVVLGRGGGDCNDGDPTISPSRPELCANLVDDDCDGATDYGDRGDCPDPPDNDTCDRALPLVPSLSFVEADTTGFGNERFSGWCGGFGPDAYFLLHLIEPRRVVLDTRDSGLDTVIWVLSGTCDGDELACNDDRTDVPAAGSRIEFRALDPGDYVIVVAGRDPGIAGPFQLNYSIGALPPAATCSQPIDATPGGTIIGRLTDTSWIESGSCGGLLGNQERFTVNAAVPLNLFISTAGTTFPAAVYVQAGTCDSWDERACAGGPAGDGALVDLPAWTGRATITLDYTPGGVLPDPDPRSPYRIEINP